MYYLQIILCIFFGLNCWDFAFSFIHNHNNQDNKKFQYVSYDPILKCTDSDDSTCTSLPSPPNISIEFKPLSKQAKIFYMHNFLSDEEIQYILEFVSRTGGWTLSPTGGINFKVVNEKQYPKAIVDDPVFHQIEKRIANATGIPIHPDEDIISLAHITSRGNHIREGNYLPFGLHLDSDTRPHRARTILIYLTDVAAGGRTIFPLARKLKRKRNKIKKRENKKKKTEKNNKEQYSFQKLNKIRKKKLKKQTYKMFKSALSVNLGGPENGFSRQVTFDVHNEHPFNDLLQEMCSGSHSFVVAFKPKKGSAIMFDSLLDLPSSLNISSRKHKETMYPPRYLPSQNTWHGGCNVRSGTKIILQKFKELPQAYRDTKLFNT